MTMKREGGNRREADGRGRRIIMKDGSLKGKEKEREIITDEKEEWRETGRDVKMERGTEQEGSRWRENWSQGQEFEPYCDPFLEAVEAD